MDEQLENMPQEEQSAESTPAEETSAYIPRPAWQVWLARICLVLFILLILLHYINMLRGG